MSCFQRISAEIAKIRKLSVKDAVWYVWEYYKFSIIVTAILIALAVSFFGTLFDASEIYLSNLLINLPIADQDGQTPLAVQFKEEKHLREEDIISEVTLYLSFDDSYSQENYAALERLYVMVAAQEIDLMAMPASDFQSLSEIGIYGNLEQMLPKDLWDIVKDYAVYITDLDNENLFPAALSISGVNGEATAICIAANTPHLENCVELLRFLFSNN